MDDQWHTVAEAGESLGIPTGTIRRYLRTHGQHLKARKYHKKYQIHDDSIQTIQMIRDLYGKGKSQDEIDRILDQKGITRTITVEPIEDDRLDLIMDKLDKQDQMMAMMAEQIQKQNEYIKQSIDARDQRLIEAIRESLEARKQIASAEEEKRSFWSRLFKR